MATTEQLKQTPLHDIHVALGARMMPFAGYDMPVQYTGIIEEHVAVRERAGLFDVSHMGEFTIRGPHATEFVQHLVSNDVTKMYDGRAMYTVMCYEDGGIVDDLIVYRLSEEDYFVVVNASNIQKDWDWMVSNNPMKAQLDDVSDQMALLALQGPRAFEIASRVTDLPIDELKFYHFLPAAPGAFFGCDTAYLSHTGYTGEPGLEIYCESRRAGAVWESIMAAGADVGLQPAGLGARDTLRMESGYCLYGNDITEKTNPIEAGLGWVTKIDKGDFLGREAIVAIKERGPTRKLIGFVLEDRGIPRAGYPILSTDGLTIGEVTSGTQSPLLSRGIGLGYVQADSAYTKPGSPILIDIRGKSISAVVRKPPFHKEG